MIRVLNIQGDEQLGRLMVWILRQGGFDVVGIADDPVPGHPMPDVIIMNTELPATDKASCISALRALVPGVRVVDIGDDGATSDGTSGADAYLPKPFHGDELIDAVNAVNAA
jgi:DNA-binding response OmpR family regulator